MKGILKSYFNYSRRQMRGIFVLVLLIFIALMIPFITDYFSQEELWDHSAFIEEIKKLNSEQKTDLLITDSTGITPFPFDPNKASLTDLKKLGMSEKLANTLLKYRKSGGVFNEKQDLKKVYGINDSIYLKLKPFIIINNNKKNLKHEKSKITVQDTLTNINYLSEGEKKKDSEKLIELNSADSTQLVLLKGIGPVLSMRIITYRKFLGGYYHKEQLLEVFGITQELIKQIELQITFDTSKIEKIDLNNTNFKELNNHPYIEYIDTKNILKYKELMGNFNNVDELLTNHLIEANRFQKLKPYLSAN